MRWNKYHVASKDARTYDGIVFVSKAEMSRYSELKLLERCGYIEALARQPQYQIIPKGARNRGHIYTADFWYVEHGHEVVEEVKGVYTADYTLRRDLFLLQYPEIVFREIHNGKVKEKRTNANKCSFC
jgi:hypothetical protein